MINHTNEEIVVRSLDAENQTWFLAPSTVFAPPKLDSFFTLGIIENKKSFHSNSLQLSQEERWYTLKFEGRIPRNGSTSLKIETDERVCRFTVLSNYKEGIQIMQLLPTFTIVNISSVDLFLRRLNVKVQDSKLVPPEKTPTIIIPSYYGKQSEIEETPLLMWDHIDKNGSVTLKEELHCIQLSKNNQTFSQPVIIEECDGGQRINATVPSNDDDDSLALNHPIIITTQRCNDQVKIVIHDDISPQMIIHNNTDEVIILGKLLLQHNHSNTFLT